MLPPTDPPFKKSFRDERLVAAVALVDPDLLAGCPPTVIAGDGMDALTQLLEAFTSTGASPFTRRGGAQRTGRDRRRAARLARGRARGDGGAGDRPRAGGDGVGGALFGDRARERRPGRGPRAGRAAGGAVRDPPRDGLWERSWPPSTRANVAALSERAPASPALARYAEAGRLLAGDPSPATGAPNDDAARHALLATLDGLTTALRIPGLGASGVTADAFPALVAESRGSSMRTNPIVLTDAEIGAILAASR